MTVDDVTLTPAPRSEPPYDDERPSMTEFWAARLGETELAAREAYGWDTGSREAGQPDAWVRFWRSYPPARVLREVERDRQIMALHEENAHRDCALCRDEVDAGWPCRTVRLCVAVWDSHPDYREEWRP